MIGGAVRPEGYSRSAGSRLGPSGPYAYPLLLVFCLQRTLPAHSSLKRVETRGPGRRIRKAQARDGPRRRRAAPLLSWGEASSRHWCPLAMRAQVVCLLACSSLAAARWTHAPGGLRSVSSELSSPSTA